MVFAWRKPIASPCVWVVKTVAATSGEPYWSLSRWCVEISWGSVDGLSELLKKTRLALQRIWRDQEGTHLFFPDIVHIYRTTLADNENLISTNGESLSQASFPKQLNN